MSNDRLRVPQDQDYFETIGLAAVAFARLEWSAVWCCERISPGYINTIEPKKKTAGVIANDLRQLIGRVSNDQLRIKCTPFVEEFKSIVPDRNAILHGKPGTTSNEDQRLFRNGIEVSIEVINAFSDRCVLAAEPLNALLHAELAENCQVELEA